MGTLRQRIGVASASGEVFEELEALVDTGATYTWVPRPSLERLGVAPEESFPFVLADGRTAEYPIAQVRIRLDGRTRVTVCVFGEEGTEPLLGNYTLEGFGLAVDPLNKRLITVRGYLLRGTGQ